MRKGYSFFLAIAVLFAAAAIWTSPRAGDAQDNTEGRISALETQVADQAKDISSLRKRVKKLEDADKPSSADSQESTSSSESGEPVSLTGVGPSVTDKFALEKGTYKVTATLNVNGDFDGFSVYFYDPNGNKELVFNEIIDQGGAWTASAVYQASSEGQYFAEVSNTSSDWTITIEPL